jgi:hypothetical protein
MTMKTTAATAPGPALNAVRLVGIAGRVGQMRHEAQFRYDRRYKAALKAKLITDLYCFTLWAAQNGKPILKQPHPQGWKDFYIIHAVVHEIGQRWWEHLWDEKHADRPGGAWQGQDFDLMRVWREKMRGLLRDCRQDAVFDMDYEGFITTMTDAGANPKEAEQAADWLADVMWEDEGDTPSCAVVEAEATDT